MKYREHDDPLYFIKMVALNGADHEKTNTREIYYMSVAGD